MPTMLNGTIRNNTVVLGGDDLSQFDGCQVVISIIKWRPAKQKEETYGEKLHRLFGSGRDNDFEIPDELDLTLDAARVAL